MGTAAVSLQDPNETQPTAAEGTVPSGTFDKGPLYDPKDLFKGEEDIQKAIKAACVYFVGLDKWIRRMEVIDARRQRFYWRNDQYIYWKSDSVGFIPAIAGQSLSAGTETVNIGRYTDVYNIYTPYGETILSTLIQNPPGVNWQAIDPAEPKDVVASKTAEKYQQKIESQNDRKELQSTVSRLFYTDGRTVLYTHRTKDGIDKIQAYGVLETKPVPLTASCQEELVALAISDDLDIYKAKGEYPDYKDKIKNNASSLGESAYERIARLGVMQGTRLLMQAGDAFSHIVSRHVIFIRPDGFEKIDDKSRDEVKRRCPDGLKVTFCGDQYCGAENIRLDDQITVGFPGPGDGMSRPSLGKRIIPLQDVFNDEINLWHEAHDYCVPTLFMYSETGDIEGINEQISQPGSVVPFSALPPGASSAEAAFYSAALEAIPATLPEFIQFVQGPLAQFISGAFPALFGGDTGDNDTAKGIAIQRDQAMGRMSLAWGSLQKLFAGAYTNAVKSAVKNAEEGQNFSYSYKNQLGTSVAEELSLDDLAGGHCVCKADTDASFPESTNSKRASYQTLMAAAERNPILASVMADPNNLEFGHEVIGLPDLKVPGATSRNKQLIEIAQMLNEPPIPPTMQEIQGAAVADPQLLQAMAAWETNKIDPDGKPIPPPIPDNLYHSSIPVDAEFDSHAVEYQTIADWLSGEDRRREEELNNNRMGILNVRLHGLAHKALIPPPPEPAPTKSGKNGPQAAAPALAAGTPH